jgi:hypothetical protein
VTRLRGNGMRIIPRTAQSADVHVGTDGASMRIGHVGADGPSWWWQHRDGERSSPVAQSRAEAAEALVQYHDTFKQSAPAPARRFSFG